MLFILDARAAPGVAPLYTTLLLTAPPLVPAVRGTPPLLEQGAFPTVTGQLAAPLLRHVCPSIPA